MSDLKEKIRDIITTNNKFPNYFNDKERHLMRQNYWENKKDEASVPKEPTFWTTFLFQGTSPQDLHCTHKFLGEQDDSSVRKIINTLDKYFAKKKFKSFKEVFGVEQFFGENKDIRVLTPFKHDEKNYLLDLRDKLNKFNEDTYTEYLPHVTTSTIKKVDFPISGYALLYGSTILRKYE